MSEVTLGGDRLGAGNKQKVKLHNYERSTHDLSYVWRSTMGSGTLVPFMSEVGLPGDNFEIDLNVDLKTHPTIGPLFGSYKVQLDVFQCPMRLYNGKLHMNMLNIGLNMNEIKLPQINIISDGEAIGDNSQINPSSLLSYLNIRGIGKGAGTKERQFNAIPLLAYWDIYKNYYANKQEEIGAYIHSNVEALENAIETFKIYQDNSSVGESLGDYPGTGVVVTFPNPELRLGIQFENENEPVHDQILILDSDTGLVEPITKYFHRFNWEKLTRTLHVDRQKNLIMQPMTWVWYQYSGEVIDNDLNRVRVNTFPLSNIDNMREDILSAVKETDPFVITQGATAPYGPTLVYNTYNKKGSLMATQEGLGLKTYQSDLFNNWISTEWIDGDNGINAITAVDTSSGEFTLNTLQLSNKVYQMLNRIAVSGGSYDDWLNAVYTHERTRSQESPMYMGGLIKELAFQEVVSNAAATQEDVNQPLGTLAGRGILTQKNKGGKINVRVDEPSYIMGIISLTPRVDYSQGNKWDTNLKTLDDLHKPALDEIGFQDLITDQMAWWDTYINPDGDVIFKSAGKQPAWINYMTNVNQVRGNFAEQTQQMFMTLNRRYEESDDFGSVSIKDLTTYIDPTKFNNIFADTRLDAQNFWAQIAVNIKARRKMSARLMPNL